MLIQGFRMRAASLLVAMLATSGAMAEEKITGPAVAAPAAAQDTRPLDRDGKPVYGAELMTEQELGGYRSLMHFTKTLPERDALRAEHRRAMDLRAKERGVKLAD
jgi:hypothetical protein